MSESEAVSPGRNRPSATQAVALPPKAAVGWHFHRWTPWEDDRIISTFITGARIATQVQTRRCAKCRKMKVRRV